jgi:hypothetical protein
MTTASLRRKIALLLLLSTFSAASWAAASPRRESPRAGTAAFLVLDLVSRAWSRLAGVLTKEGCHIDPNGSCLTGTSPAPPPAGEEGCNIAPDGCTSAQTDTGCYIDPNGLCRS